jgi:hypothetical protein
VADRGTRTGLDDLDQEEVLEADRLEREPAVAEIPDDRSPEADEADQLEQAATLTEADEDYPHES